MAGIAVSLFVSLGVTAEMVAALITDDSTSRPRSKQRTIGPSGLGNPCQRRLGYQHLNVEPASHGGDPLPAWVGTEVHKGMERILEPLDDWTAEIRVYFPGYDIYGTADAYHHPTGTVVDWKCTGAATITKVKANGPGQQYRTQAHLYGCGLAMQGHDVRNVAVVFIPRSGITAGIHVWTEPYDEQVVEDALRRWEAIGTVADAYGPAALGTADGPCNWCPWWQPGAPDITKGCPGHTAGSEEKAKAEAKEVAA